MSRSHPVTLPGAGLIGVSYTMTLQGSRSRARVHVIYSRIKATVQHVNSEPRQDEAAAFLANDA
ncbi:MAG: hypothetical protein IAE81_19600 [Caldilineaceae bacterium]|jgi:hypothetical protein|nr:hypothetical protein [Caldilineaceae bacterium]